MTRFPAGREGGGASHQRGNAFLTPARAVVKVLYKLAPSINYRRQPQPSRQRRVKLKPLKNLRPSGPSTLKPAGLVHKAPATKGGSHYSSGASLACFPTPAGRLYGFSRQRRHKKRRPKGRRTSLAQRYYITPEGESPQPVREASAGPGQNPGSPGPKARRRHQPSRRSRVNLREYRKAPPKSRSRPRRRRLNPQSPKGLVFPSMTPRSLYPPAPRSSSLAASLARSSMA